MRLHALSLAILLTASPLSFAADDYGLHLDWRDTTINPGQDFYHYANSNWQKENPIPPEYPSWGTFNILQDKILNTVHEMLIQASQDTKAKPGSLEQKVGDFYYSGMDTKSIDAQGIKPLQPQLDAIAGMSTLSDLQKVITDLQLIGVDALFNFGSMQDFKNSEQVIAAAYQGGLGLPDRDYYLKDSAKFKAIRQAYVEHVAKMFELMGDKPDLAQAQAKTVMRIETALAKVSMSQIAMRDPYAIYHIKSLKELEQATPAFSWPNYLNSLKLSKVKQLNLAMPDFFKGLNQLLGSVSLNDWKIYLRWHLVDSFAPYLSHPFVMENFKMNSTLSGTKKLLPRWKRVVATENSALGFAIGKLYVEKYFPPESKMMVIDMINNIKLALKGDLKSLSWMDEKSRKAALKKLSLMEARVGYPDKWRDYSRLSIDRGPYVLNVMRTNTFLSQLDLDKIGKPVDKTEWAMTPQTINAYYDPSRNNLNIPAGILQPPFFDPKAPAAVNYGAIGFVIGHEITHGFDDQGAKFDGQGNLRNWWTPADLQKFKKATECISRQFDQYKIDGQPVQGQLVVGEATADLGGITLAYHAFHHSKSYQEAKTIAGVTPDQQFFLGTAHVWAMNIRPEMALNLLTVDPHPPAVYRVNGSLVNIPAFQTAFSLPNDSPMVSNQRCTVW